MNTNLWQDGRMGKKSGAPRLLFAQVREDAAIELEVLRSLPEGQNVFCIASGGCTAFALLLARPHRVHVVDINAAQVFLVEIKMAAMTHLSYSQFLHCLLRSARPFYPQLRPHLSEVARRFWDSHRALLWRGLNNCGAIEIHLRRLMFCLPLAQSRRNIRRMFGAKSLEEQRQIYESSWDNRRWHKAFKIALSKRVLKRAYSEEAVKDIPATFAHDLKSRFDEAFTRYPIGENGYLWQTFRGAYPPHEKALPLYLQHENQIAVREGLQKIHLECADAVAYFEAQEPDSIGFFSLSNILELALPEFATRLLRAISRVAKQDAKIFIRSIFPLHDLLFDNLDLENKARFERLPTQFLEERDRSVFCKNLMLLQVHKETQTNDK